MNSINSTPVTKVENEPMLNGLNHDSEGVRWLPGASPVATRTRAQMANTASMTSSIESSTCWKRADSSMPR